MSRYHLRNNLFFEVEDGSVVVSWSPPTKASKVLCKVPYHEWASVIAFTSQRGENAETYGEALDFLTAPLKYRES